jgi:hypothetical protein
LRAKADLLLNAASGLLLNLSSRAFSLGANDSILASGLVRSLADSASYATSSLATSCNCLTIIGRLLQSQTLRDELCCDAQHATKLLKLFLSTFHAHAALAPRLLTLTAVCALLQSPSCAAAFFRCGDGLCVSCDV